MTEVFDPFVYPWFPIFLSLLAVSILLIREIILLSRFAQGHPERGITLFNLILLLVFLCTGIVCTYILFGHVKKLESQIPPYPLSRYAPEQLLLAPSDWVFTTNHNPSEIQRFYERWAQENAQHFLVSTSSTAVHFLFFEEVNPLFLTLIYNQRKTMLYYSHEGEVIKTQP